MALNVFAAFFRVFKGVVQPSMSACRGNNEGHGEIIIPQAARAGYRGHIT
jgi:hypothetical protein